MKLNTKLAPTKFKGNINNFPISKLMEYISYTCFFYIKNQNDEAVLFFKDGKIINARINEEYGISQSKDILTWENGDFFYQKLDQYFKIDIKYIKDVLFFVKLLKSNCQIDISFNKNIGLIVVKDGNIEHIKINGKTDKDALSTILKSKKGDIRYKPIRNINKKVNTKTDIMNVKKINESIEILKEDLGDALITTAIWSSSDGQLIASYNPQPKAAALFSTVTSHINNSLRDGGLPGLDKYYMLDLEADSLILVVIFEGFQMGLLVNSKKVQLGLLLNVVMPKARETFIDAIK